MRKPRKESSGFSNIPENKTSKKKPFLSAADQTNKEQQALALINQGKVQEASSIYRELISAGTRNHIVYGNLATICGMQGRFNELIELLRKALKLKHNYPDAHNNLGIALHEQGDLDAAVASYKTALKLDPNHSSAHYNLGDALQDKGDLTAAIASYNKALQLNPNYPEAHNNLGIALLNQGDLVAAITSLNKALQLNPNYPEAHNNLGKTLQEQGDLSAAIASFKKALRLNPKYPDAHNNLGIVLLDQGGLTAAIASFNKALQLNPNYPEAHNNLGIALRDQGDLTAAIASYNKAVHLNPNYPEAQKNLSMAELLIGDYKSGFQRYEHRFQCKEDRGILYANPSSTKWDGKMLSPGTKLLLTSEQGLGDTLQFMRYASAFKSQGLAISLCAPVKLHSLIRASGIDASPLNHEQANLITEGQWIPLLSAARHLGVSPKNPVITQSYIKTTDDLIDKWKITLGTKERPVVGINWQGNPLQERTNSKGRSLPLETFKLITEDINISLVSLQKGPGSEQLETCSFKDQFVSCQDQISETWDFLETAAIIANCDLVITSDTSVAHLAGGMGKTTWLLLHKVPDWRWGLEGDTTFWYPSMRLFRQKERGNWEEAMERVAVALQEHFGSGSTPPKPAPAPQPALKPEQIQDILAPISLGELIDKITILQIKTQHLQGTALENVKKELEVLENTLNDLQLNIDNTLIQCLKEINQDLWQIEDDIRDQERRKSFGETFIRLARSVYQQNDRRAAIKKEINTTYGSIFIEEKSYQQY